MIIYDNDQVIDFDPNIHEYPEALKGSWWVFTYLDDHPVLAGICSIYFNDKYPSGTVIISNYVLDQYPDLYATWDKQVNVNKSFVSPKLRKNGKGKTALMVGDKILKFTGNTLQYRFGDHQNGDFLVKGTYSLDKKIEERVVDDSVMFDFRDPVYPVIHFDKRFLKYEV